MLLPILMLAGCGESGEATQNVVQAATHAAAETGQQLAQKAAELAQTAPEAARAKMQEFVDLAVSEFEAAKDSETAKKVAAEVDAALAKLAELRTTLTTKLNLAGLETKVGELIERFKNDPHVVAALKALQERLNQLTR